MKISTRLRLAVYIPALMALVIVAALVVSYQEMERIQANGDTIRQIRSGITELNHFVFSYILYPGERPKQQFLAGHESLSLLIAGAQFQNPDQQRLLDSIRRNNETMEDLFLQIAPISELTGTARTDDLQREHDRLLGLLLVKSYQADADAAQLRSMVDAGIRTTELRTTGLIFLAIIIATIPLTILLRRTKHGITSSLSTLSQGAAIIGSGNLDFRIDEKGNDEIGDLSRAFNTMTTSLKGVTASKIELEREIIQRQKAEEEIKAQEALLKTVFNTMPAQINLMGGNDLRIRLVNTAYQSIAPGKEMIGKTLDELWPETRQDFTKLCRRVLETGEPYHVVDELNMVSCSPGSPPEPRYFTWSLYRVELPGGDGQGILNVSMETTERKQAEQKLVEQAAMLASVNDAIIGYDTGYRITYWNQAAEEIYGYSATEALGKVSNELLKPTYPGITREELVARITRDGHIEAESGRTRKDGRTLYIETHVIALKDEKGRIISYTAVDRDITERKRMEEALSKSKEELATVLANVPMVTLVVDAERKVLDVNAAAIRFAGRRIEDMVGQRAGEALHCLNSLVDPQGCGFSPACAECKTRLNINDTIETGHSHYEVEWRLPFLRDGKTEEISFLLSTILLPPPGKRVLICIQNITGLKKTEEALKQTNVELEVSNKELEAFSYSVSHDLRAPLRSMEGFSNALLEDYSEKLDDQGKQYLRFIQESSDLMARLIDDLLKLSRVTRSDMSYESVNLSEMAGKIVAELEKAEPGCKAKVTISTDITAYGDHNLLRLALENLLGNAWKFCGKTDSPRIEMGTTEQSGRLVYYVRDNGVGFDMTYADKLFKPFQRLHKATEFPGTGIGLATVQRIIRRHGGEVWAESKVKEGATFYFTLG